MRSTRSIKAAGQRRRRSEEERLEVLERYVASGQTQRVFALKEGIGVSTLQLWLRTWSAAGERVPPVRLDSRTSSVRAKPISLLEVEVTGQKSPARVGDRAGYEVELVGGTRLRMEAGFAEAEVRRLLAVLKEVD